MAGRRTSVGVKAEMADLGQGQEAAESIVRKKQYVVKSPDTNFCGVGGAGIQFANGRGIINDNCDDDGKTAWVMEWYKSHGYIVE